MSETNAHIVDEKTPAPSNKQTEQTRLSIIRCDVVEPLLKQKRWTRGKWVTEAGVGKNSVYEYLDGKRKLSAENRKAMAEALGVSPEQLPE